MVKETQHQKQSKESSLHEILLNEGFTIAVIPVEKTNTKNLLRVISSYDGDSYKIAIVDGSEITRELKGTKNPVPANPSTSSPVIPAYLPIPLSDYYVVYVKDVRKREDVIVNGR
jgi:hypothetical protein